MSMDIHDIEGLAVVDDAGEVLYEARFSDYAPALLYRQAVCDQETVSIIDDRIVLFKALEEICVVLYAGTDRNEVLLSRALECFSAALFRMLKKCTRKHVLKKYDMVCLLASEFVYNGIICERDPECLLGNIPSRSFEGLETMSIPQGFLSFFSEAKGAVGKQSK